jgi:hypothetical protein
MLFAPQTISDANCKPAISADLPDEAVTDLTYPSQKACVFACAGGSKGAAKAAYLALTTAPNPDKSFDEGICRE